jgi:acetyl-CoA carboxylase carboxyltransferase component/biotin carboxyl carrier protein
MGAVRTADPLRVAILEREPLAVRVVDALSAADHRPILILGAGPPPTMAERRLPEILTLPVDEWSPEGIAALGRAVASDPPDAMWAGWSGWEHALAVAELCAELRIRPLGPGADVIRSIRDPEASARMAGAPVAAARSATAVDVATIAEDAPRVLAVVGVTLRGVSEVVLAESPSGLGPEQDAEARAIVTRFREALAARFGVEASAGAITVRLAIDEGAIALVGALPAVPPWFAAAEVAEGIDTVAERIAAVSAGPAASAAGPAVSAAGPAVSRADRVATAGPEAGRAGSGAAAVTAVLRAEDPLAGFRPGRGQVRSLRLSAGPGIRLDPATTVGDRLAPAGEEGATLALITASANDPAGARALLSRALAGSAVVTSDAPTDRAALLSLLSGAADDLQLSLEAGVALIDAAIAVHRDRERRRRERFLASAARGRPEVGEESSEPIELRHGTRDHTLHVLHVGPDEYVVRVGGRSIAVGVGSLGPFERRLVLPGGTHEVVQVHRDPVHVVEVDGALHRVADAAGSVTVAPGPAVVVQTLVAPGDEVAAGDPLVVLEAMKMEMTLTAPAAGVVRYVVGRNVQVGAGEPLVRVDDDRAEPLEVPEARIDVPDLAPGPSREEGFRQAAAGLRRLLLGFDVEADAAADLAAAWTHSLAEAPPDRPEVVAAEEDVLGTFADVAAVAAARRPAEPEAELVPAPADPFPVYLRTLDAAEASLPPAFVDDLRRALARHGVHSFERTPELEEALFRIARANARSALQGPPLVAILDRWLEHAGSLRVGAGPEIRELLDRVARVARGAHPAVADLALEVRYRWFDERVVERAIDRAYDAVQRTLVGLQLAPDRHRGRRIQALVNSPLPLRGILIPSALAAGEPADGALLEALIRRYYRIRDLEDVRVDHEDGRPVGTASYVLDGATVRLVATVGTLADVDQVARILAKRADALPDDGDVLTDCFLASPAPPTDELEPLLREALDAARPSRRVRRAVVTLSGPPADRRTARQEHFTFRQPAAGEPFVEDRLYRGLHPMMGKRLDLWRLSEFDIERLPSAEAVYLFRAVAKENPRDERLVCLTEVRDLTPLLDESGRVTSLPHLERVFTEALAAIRLYQSHRPANRRVQWNRILLNVRPVADLGADELFGLVRRMTPLTEGLGLEKVLVRANLRDAATGEIRDRIMHISNPVGRGLTLRFDDPADRPIRPLTPYWQKVVQARQRGLVYPYELMRMLAPGDGHEAGPFPHGSFVEHDLDESETRLVPVDRPPGENIASIVAGVITNVPPAHPEGMTRVAILGDPSRGLGSLAEAECRRICAALDLAEQMDVPLEWFAVSSGARISMESGTENMDWIGRVLRRLIEFTQAGGEVNVVVCGINVGAQPYWNAEATMLMHTRGILVMTANGALVLTGKDALDYSGGVSAEDNFGIGGYDRVMGPNGQAQYWAADVAEACAILLRHYEHTYRMPGEPFPRRVATDDPFDRDVGTSPHRGEGMATVAEIFSERTNPDRKRPFDIRSVMRAVVDADHGVLERWANMRDAETVVVWDAFIGGFPVALLGIESKPVPRLVPGDADGPQAWTSGTLFPQSSKKAARAINAASANRPLVVLANLSGFDGSPESMRKLQLEYGAEIGRAVTNFSGPIVFLVISRYHGGAFVVFSQTLNQALEVAAVEGSYASVIGGAPAAAVVFAREIDSRVANDPAIRDMEERLAAAAPEDRAHLRAQLDDLRAVIRAERLGDVAEEFDDVHDIHRALKVGSVHRIIEPSRIRPYLIDALERGVVAHVQGAATTSSTSSP